MVRFGFAVSRVPKCEGPGAPHLQWRDSLPWDLGHPPGRASGGSWSPTLESKSDSRMGHPAFPLTLLRPAQSCQILLNGPRNPPFCREICGVHRALRRLQYVPSFTAGVGLLIVGNQKGKK